MSTPAKVRLPDVAQIVMGQSPLGDTYNDLGEGMPFFQGKTEFGEVSPTVRKWCTQPKKIAKAGDILISVRAPVGPTNLADVPCCIGRGLAAIRADSNVLTPEYLRYALRSAEPFLASMGQGSTFAAIGRAELGKVEFPMPQISEQRRIVDLISRAEGIVRLRREAQQKAAELVPAIFLEMFGDPATNPKHWPIAKIESICEVKTGATPLRERKDFYENGTVPWIKTGEVKNGEIFDAEERITELAVSSTNCKVFPMNTILIAMYGQGQTRGRCGILKVPASTNQACVAILPSEHIRHVYLFELFRLQYQRLRAMGRGGNQANLNMGMIMTFAVPIPPENLQLEFEQRIQFASSIQRQQESALAISEQVFASLLGKSFS